MVLMTLPLRMMLMILKVDNFWFVLTLICVVLKLTRPPYLAVDLGTGPILGAFSVRSPRGDDL